LQPTKRSNPSPLYNPSPIYKPYYYYSCLVRSIHIQTHFAANKTFKPQSSLQPQSYIYKPNYYYCCCLVRSIHIRTHFQPTKRCYHCYLVRISYTHICNHYLYYILLLIIIVLVFFASDYLPRQHCCLPGRLTTLMRFVRVSQHIPQTL
jgi:hypothetical protein